MKALNLYFVAINVHNVRQKWRFGQELCQLNDYTFWQNLKVGNDSIRLSIRSTLRIIAYLGSQKLISNLKHGHRQICYKKVSLVLLLMIWMERWYTFHNKCLLFGDKVQVATRCPFRPIKRTVTSQQKPSSQVVQKHNGGMQTGNVTRHISQDRGPKRKHKITKCKKT